MTPEQFIREHRHLVKVLRGGSVKKQLAEAKSQAAELKRFLKKKK